MTIEDILQCSADQLEAMSDAELEKHFAPFLNVTRPEMAAVRESAKTSAIKHKNNVRNDPNFLKGLELLKQHGIEL